MGKVSLIPNDTDILITHCPPYSGLDRTIDGQHMGSRELLRRLEQLSNLKLHVFGHIHESFGNIEFGGPILANVSNIGMNGKSREFGWFELYV